ncbi:hypothetical protein ACRAWD_02475 [Caulobacter segnis]
MLVIVDQEKLADPLEFWEGAEKRLLDELLGGPAPAHPRQLHRP